MARWSDCMKLADYGEWRGYLKGYSGVYEIGYVRDSYFTPRYIGKATCLYNRLSSYMSFSRCHNAFLYEKLMGQRRNLWFHVYKTAGFGEAELALLRRFGIKGHGLYIWNQKYG